MKKYSDFNDMKLCYSALYDDISRKMYMDRLSLDLSFDPSIVNHMVELYGADKRFISFGYDISSVLKAINEKIPIIIYGAGHYGKQWCEFLKTKHAKIIGFYDKNYKNLQNVMGFPVLEPPQKADGEYLILITPVNYIDDIYDDLLKKGFTPERLLKGCSKLENDIEHQYFDFRDKYPEGGAFIDAGCFDCDTSLRFSHWCNDKYSKIFAFEPDEKNIEICKQVAKQNGLERIEFYQLGLAKQSGAATFCVTGTSSSYISEDLEQGQKIILSTLDEIVGETKVSFIKMDIEGSELSALQGATEIIQRDKPLCAISVYHKPGDMVVIMDYLLSLVPEYKFALRHYSNVDAETVLYAFL